MKRKSKSSTNGTVTKKQTPRNSKSKTRKIEETPKENEDNLTSSEDESTTVTPPTPIKKRKTPTKSKIKEPERETETEEEEEDEEKEYEVEKIINQKKIGGILHYQIRWKNHTSESDTWEPASTLNCPDILAEFKKRYKTQRKVEKKLKESEEWDENEDYEVVRILDVHFRKDGKREFLVSWKGYPTKYNSWVPEEDMECKDMIEKFLKKCSDAKKATQKELRVNRKVTDRFTLNTKETGRRLSRRNEGKQRIQYHETE